MFSEICKKMLSGPTGPEAEQNSDGPDEGPLKTPETNNSHSAAQNVLLTFTKASEPEDMCWWTGTFLLLLLVLPCSDPISSCWVPHITALIRTEAVQLELQSSCDALNLPCKRLSWQDRSEATVSGRVLIVLQSIRRCWRNSSSENGFFWQLQLIYHVFMSELCVLKLLLKNLCCFSKWRQF